MNDSQTIVVDFDDARVQRQERLDDVVKIIENKPLEPTSPVPLYAQLAERLSAYISSLGEQGVGRLFPSENECIRLFGVSRPTVRQAISELEARGLVRKERGRGTFICEPRLVHDISHIFDDDMRAARRTVSFEVLEHGFVKPTPAHLKTFGDNIHRLYRVLRLRSVAGRIMGLEERFLPEQYERHLTPAVLSESHVFSILRLFTPGNEITTHNAVRAVTLGAHDAALTGVAAGSPALVRETTYFSDDDKQPLMFGIVTFLADRYQLRFESTIALK